MEELVTYMLSNFLSNSGIGNHKEKFKKFTRVIDTFENLMRAAVENSLVVIQKVRITIGLNNSASMYIPQRIENNTQILVHECS